MHVVVGLGNPGADYVTTRHNLGFMVVEQLANRWHVDIGPEKSGVRIGCGTIAGHDTLLAEPYRYMNRSGEALAALAIDPNERQMIVVHDDVDLPERRLRLRRNGGSGGHRGIRSIVDTFGPDFDRVRIGIGRPPIGRSVVDYVLAPMSTAELDRFAEIILRASDAVERILDEGIERAMNQFNSPQPCEADAWHRNGEVDR
jgi:PTH1 family peptidyl-tRNA hydrolase